MVGISPNHCVDLIRIGVISSMTPIIHICGGFASKCLKDKVPGHNELLIRLLPPSMEAGVNFVYSPSGENVNVKIINRFQSINDVKHSKDTGPLFAILFVNNSSLHIISFYPYPHWVRGNNLSTLPKVFMASHLLNRDVTIGKGLFI